MGTIQDKVIKSVTGPQLFKQSTNPLARVARCCCPGSGSKESSNQPEPEEDKQDAELGSLQLDRSSHVGWKSQDLKKFRQRGSRFAYLSKSFDLEETDKQSRSEALPYDVDGFAESEVVGVAQSQLQSEAVSEARRRSDT